MYHFSHNTKPALALGMDVDLAAGLSVNNQFGPDLCGPERMNLNDWWSPDFPLALPPGQNIYFFQYLDLCNCKMSYYLLSFVFINKK